MLYDYIIFTDGAYSRKHNEGAFAFVILDFKGNEVLRYARKIENETNNRAELKAIIAAVYKLPSDARYVVVISDSLYALRTLKGSYSRHKNTDLFDVWEKVLKERSGLRIEYEWVKGHSGEEYNELCDRMCVEVLGYDPIYEYTPRPRR